MTWFRPVPVIVPSWLSWDATERLGVSWYVPIELPPSTLTTAPVTQAAACLHGGRMVWEGESSPHRYIPRVAGALHFGFAADDETCPDAHKALIEATIAASGARAATEHYAAAHGWTFPTRWCHDREAAERAFVQVVALFDREVAAGGWRPRNNGLDPGAAGLAGLILAGEAGPWRGTT